LLGDESLVCGVLRDLETSSLDHRHKALFRFISKVNADSTHIGEPEIDALHLAGWEDDAIFYAITVCALFNFYNRWTDATGVHAMSDEAHRAAGRRMAAAGYVR
jgi:alkylhydroperoxidase family enzyme